jgi:hypothetical protein
MGSDSVKAVCGELLALASEYVELGGRIEEVFNRPLVFLEADSAPASGARDVGPPYKIGEDLLKLLATLRSWTAQLKQDQLRVSVTAHRAAPVI